jgi:hypothetical protein
MKTVDIWVSMLCWGLCFALGAIGVGCVNGRGRDEAELTAAISEVTVDPGAAEALDGEATSSDRPGCSDPRTCGDRVGGAAPRWVTRSERYTRHSITASP